MARKRADDSGKRFDRERWLQSALDVLAQEGSARLRVDALSSSLNVTKGSFYHHFRDRSDFVEKLAEYWASRYNDHVVREIGAQDGSPEDRLRNLMRMIKDGGFDRYDTAFRSWAAQDPTVAKALREVDLGRYRFIRGLFEEMGFSGTELETRVRAWLVFASANASINYPSSDHFTAPDLDAFLDFFVRK